MENMSTYIPLALVIVMVAGAIVIERSIITARHGTAGEPSFMSYALEVFVFILFAVAISVIVAVHRELGMWGFDTYLQSQQRGGQTIGKG